MDLRDFSLFLHEGTSTGRASFFTEIAPFLTKNGMMASALPKEYGGMNADLPYLADLIKEHSTKSSGSALIHALHLIFSRAIMESDLDETVKQDIAKDIADGNVVNAFRVDIGSGSTSRHGTVPKTIARRALDGWILSGEKKFCSGSLDISYMGVYAITDEVEPRVGTFLVKNLNKTTVPPEIKSGFPALGVRVSQIWQGPGLYQSMSDSIKFDHVFVPDEYAMNLRPASEPALRSNPLRSAVLLSALYQAVAENAFRHFRYWTMFKALDNDPRYIEAAGKISAFIQTNEIMIKHFAKLDEFVQTGLKLEPSQVSLLKYTVLNNARECMSIIEPLIRSSTVDATIFLDCLSDILCGMSQTPATDQALNAAGLYALKGS